MGARRPRWIVLGALAVAAGGCGGGATTTTTVEKTVDESSTTTADTPTGSAPIADAIDALAEVGKGGGECQVDLEVAAQVQLPDPEAGATPENCKAAQRFLLTLRGFKPGQSEEFGTGAVVDGTQAGKELTVVLALDGSKSFTWSGLTLSRPEVGTSPIKGMDYQRNADRLVAALRDGDCHAAHEAIGPQTRLTYSSEDEFCSAFDENFMTKPDGLGVRLQSDDQAELTDLGGTADVHFFGLATEPAGYRTLIVSSATQSDPVVADVIPLER
jgi:hypothetical protein